MPTLLSILTLFVGVISGWQTVSVRTIDEEKEREESEAAVEAMRRGDHTEEVSFTGGYVGTFIILVFYRI